MIARSCSAHLVQYNIRMTFVVVCVIQWLIPLLMGFKHTSNQIKSNQMLEFRFSKTKTSSIDCAHVNVCVHLCKLCKCLINQLKLEQLANGIHAYIIWCAIESKHYEHHYCSFNLAIRNLKTASTVFLFEEMENELKFKIEIAFENRLMLKFRFNRKN